MRRFAGKILFLFAFLIVNPVACESRPRVTRDKVQEAWDAYNSPAQLDAGAVVAFGELPLAGQAARVPWSDIYWPSYYGGIALRWVDEPVSPFDTPRLTEADVRRMSGEQLARLSPAEKYDIFMGRFDFPTVQAELMRTHPSMPPWYGLCHGWSSASINFDEPGAVLVKGTSGIEVQFGSADVKALLAYAQGIVFYPAAKVLGQRCEVDFSVRPELRHTASCRDTNAGAFHLILANLVGRSGQTVIADLSRGSEVWNFPIYAYSTRELSRQPATAGAAPQAVSEIIVETEVFYITEIERPTWAPLGDSRTQASERVVYQYAIETDSLGRIVGGRWLSDQHPDFVWVQEKADFRGYYRDIESIYEQSILGRPAPLPDLAPAPVPPAEPTPAVTPTVLPDSSATPQPAATPAVPAPAATPALPPPPNAEPVSPAPAPTPAGADAPIAPVLTQPVTGTAPAVPQPVVSAPPVLNCPAGTYSMFAPFEFCTDGRNAFAPYTREMLSACLQRSGVACYNSVWPNELYISLRGEGICPSGSGWNPEYNACVEDTLVLGPFSREFVSRCLSSGFGSVCHGLKIELAYVAVMNIGR
jgi:hypothetical protein